MNAYVKSLRAPEINVILYINYISTKIPQILNISCKQTLLIPSRPQQAPLVPALGALWLGTRRIAPDVELPHPKKKALPGNFHLTSTLRQAPPDMREQNPTSFAQRQDQL